MKLIKICGLKDKKAVRAADDADYAGFIVGTPLSHRNISIKKFSELRKNLTHAKPVIVTVNQSLKFLHTLGQLDDVIIQLHGNARQFDGFLDKTALGMNYKEYDLNQYSKEKEYAFLSVDSTKKNGYGGSGETWAWRSLKHQKLPILVAGGINIENVATALELTHATGVDVSSSVEINKKKDPELIQEFITIMRKLK